MGRVGISLRAILTVAGLAAVVALLAWLSRPEPLLFHVTVEMFTIGVGLGVFLIVWNSRQFLRNNYLLLLGISYLFIAVIDLLHTIAYKNMGVLRLPDSNTATQLWIAERYLQAVSLLAAPLVLGRTVRAGAIVSVYIVATALLLVSIFAWDVFPTCSVDVTATRTELTTFKVVSEYVISGIMAGGLVLLWRKREAFDRSVLAMLVASILVGIAAELVFTLYTDVFGHRNMIGHLLILASSYLVYKALIETGLRQPYNLLFRELGRQEEALRRSEERFRTVAEFTHDWEYWRNEDQQFVYVSPSCQRITGYTVEEFMRNPELLVEITHPDDREMIRRHVDKASTVDRKHSIDFRIMHRDGSVRWLNHVCRLVVASDGRALGIRASNRDVTDRKESERQRELLQAELARRATQLETLIREAHHRIRNNLQSVVAFLEVERSRLEPAQREPLDRCISRIQAIATVHRLLTVEAADDVSLQRLLASLAELANATAIGNQQAAVEMVLTGPDVSLHSKKATSVAIVVNELMANAIEHAFRDRTRGRITVSVTRGPANGQVEVTVADDGCGFPPSPNEGTGLALSRNIVEHDLAGRFTVESGSPSGARFRIAFEP